jgi:hypothetical protein
MRRQWLIEALVRSTTERRRWKMKAVADFGPDKAPSGVGQIRLVAAPMTAF